MSEQPKRFGGTPRASYLGDVKRSQQIWKHLLRALVWALLVASATFVPSSSTQAQGNRRQPRVIQLEEIRIEGRVQKPNAFYILNRSNLGYEVLDLRTSFVREILRSVRRDPF